MKNKILFIVFLFIGWLVNGQEVNWRALDGNKNANFYDIQKDFYNYWKDKKPSKGQGYNVFKRWEARMLPRVYPSGNLSQLSSNYENFKIWERKNKSAARSPMGNWVELGPLSKPSGYDAGVGRVDFVKFNPTNPNIMYVSTPDGGLWKTTNGNDPLPTWTTYNDFLPVIGCSDLVIAPDGITMYLATGSWEADKRSIGILKSTDGGETWTTTGLTWALSDDYKIRRLIMDPTNPLVMMAATDGGVWRTTDGWVTSVTSPVSTINGNYNVDDLKFKSGDHLTVYATGRLSNKVFFRKSSDNGVTWSDVSTGLPVDSLSSRVIMGLTSADPSTIYILAGNSDGGYLGTYRSINSGVLFVEKSTSPNILNTDYPPPLLTVNRKGQASHDLAIAVSPTHADSLYIGGINQYRSINGGTDWEIVTYWYGTDPLNPGGTPGIAPYMHADVQSIQFYPGSSRILFSTCDGGISKSTNSGMTWSDLSNNLRIAQKTDIALSASDPNIMVTGLQDIGNLKNTSGAWTYIGGGDGESAFIDRTNNLNIVTSDPNGNYSVSTDGGINRESLNGNGLPAGTEFFSPIVQDSLVPTTCYAGGRPELWKSVDYLSAPSHTWTSMGTPAGTGSITRFVVYPKNPNIIYTLKQDAVSKTTNGGGMWTNITGILPVGSAYIRNITVSNTDPNKVWVVFSGYSAGNKVFRTIDGGVTWTNISGTLPNIPFNTVLHRKTSNDEVYIGADIGVYVTDNTMAAGTWVPFNTGLANSTVNDLEIYYPMGKLRAATYGRGSWESNLYTGSPTVLLSAKVFLEGPYNVGASKMNDGLRASNFIPTADPYPSLGFSHVAGELEGTNSATLVKSDPNNAIVDWVFVELRDKTNPATKLFTRSALLQRDGDIVDMDGTSPLHFSNAPSDNYYVAIRHRNHLGFRTNASVSLSNTPAVLNFTNNSVATFGTNALKQITAGVYALYSADANRDGEVNAFDLNTLWKVQNSQLGYKSADFNLDGEVNASDLNAHWKLNNSTVQQLD